MEIQCASETNPKSSKEAVAAVAIPSRDDKSEDLIAVSRECGEKLAEEALEEGKGEQPLELEDVDENDFLELIFDDLEMLEKVYPPDQQQEQLQQEEADADVVLPLFELESLCQMLDEIENEQR